jgi:hypothetical protein
MFLVVPRQNEEEWGGASRRIDGTAQAVIGRGRLATSQRRPNEPPAGGGGGQFWISLMAATGGSLGGVGAVSGSVAKVARDAKVSPQELGEEGV